MMTNTVETQHVRGCKGAIRNKAVLSASWTDEELQHAERMGCKTFHKPYQFESILSWLKKRVGLIPSDRKRVALAQVI